MPRIDLTGRQFDKLTVQYYVGNRRWHCLCSCGKEKDILYQHLVQGRTTSCGCNRKGANAKDLSNQYFGMLKAIEPTDKYVGNSIVWHCVCDCGGFRDVASTHLLRNIISNCGCISTIIHRNTFAIAKAKRLTYYKHNTDLLNLPNGDLRSNNKSGCRGVSFDTTVQSWKATIFFRGKKYYLGSSRDKQVAIEIRKEAERQIVGDFLSFYRDELSSFREVLEKKYVDIDNHVQDM